MSSSLIIVEPSGEILFQGRSLLSEPPRAELGEIEVDFDADDPDAWEPPAELEASGERPTVVPGHDSGRPPSGEAGVEPCPPTMRSADSGFFSTRERRVRVDAA